MMEGMSTGAFTAAMLYGVVLAARAWHRRGRRGARWLVFVPAVLLSIGGLDGSGWWVAASVGVFTALWSVSPAWTSWVGERPSRVLTVTVPFGWGSGGPPPPPPPPPRKVPFLDDLLK